MFCLISVQGPNPWKDRTSSGSINPVTLLAVIPVLILVFIIIRICQRKKRMHPAQRPQRIYQITQGTIQGTVNMQRGKIEIVFLPS